MENLLCHASAPFDSTVFHSPPAVCRGAPFWSWNGRLDRERLFRQLDMLRRMGMGGATIHVRIGLSEPAYLSSDFLDLVRDCVDEGDRLGLITWLYDEDRWPSGFAGGLVTSDPALRFRALRLTRTPCAPGEARPHPVHHSPPLPVTERRFAAAWALRFDGNGKLAASRLMGPNESPEPAETGLWGYVEVSPASSWFNGQTYVDTLNPAAIRRFIEVTHERYADTLGDRLGRSVPAIFTDEPLFRNMDRPAPAFDGEDHFFAWTDDLPETYRTAWGEDLFDVMPAVLFDSADGVSARARWRFRDHHAERFASAFSDQLGAWCGEHGIALTGHLMAEESLASQSRHVGDAMRSYRGFQLPGIDLLCDNLEFTTAKQAQSAARQYARPGCLSELYGVTNWDFDFQGHKRQGDWQAALGVIVRVHHLSWYSMAGEAKRDYPASIAWQSPWWREYPVVEDHFARLNTVLTRGTPRCRVAMVHPIEGFWTCDGSDTAALDEVAAQEQAFRESIRWLLHGLIDFDYLSESLLPSQCQAAIEPRLRVGAMAYEVVVLPRIRSIRSTTLDRLEAFLDGGGTVIIAGPVPDWVDGERSGRPREFARRCVRVNFDPLDLLGALEPWRDLDVREPGGTRPNGLLSQQREEGDVRWIFVCNSDRELGHPGAVLRLRGEWDLESLDTSTGDIQPVPATRGQGWTCLEAPLWAAGHLLLRASKTTVNAPSLLPSPGSIRDWKKTARLADPVPFTRDEPNVLLLDQASWRLDDGPWQPETDVLRASNLALDAAELPPLGGSTAQPWASPPAAPKHRATLAFTIVCDTNVFSPRLALERVDQALLNLNGQAVPAKAEGHWVDEDIHTVPLPDLAPGTHRLEIELPLDAWNGLEPCYLLGDFGAEVRGRHARIIPEPKTLAFGDQVHQGLPFYVGNLTLHATVQATGKPMRLAIPHFKAPLIAVDLDGKRLGTLAFAPYLLDLGVLAPGEHRLDLTIFGNRMNAFGQVHNPRSDFRWWGPYSFRTTGEDWSDEYILRPHGILTAPMLLSPSSRFSQGHLCKTTFPA